MCSAGPQTGFAGRAVVVTGGTRGIGAGIARAFLAAGADVLVCGRTGPAGLPGRAGPESLGRRPGLEGLEGRASLEDLEGRPSLEDLEGRASLEDLEGRASLEDLEGRASLEGRAGLEGRPGLEDLEDLEGRAGLDLEGRAGPGTGRAGLPAADGRSAVFARCDVRDAAQAEWLMRTAADRFGRLDLVISNAGGSPPVAAASASPRFHAKVIELNLIAPLYVAQAANAVMRDQPGGGSIVMIGSVSGTRPSPGTAAYGAAKAGLHSLAATLAVEWAPTVRVNTVIPGPVATGTAGAAAHYGGDAGAAAVGGTIPMGRMATPDDVAGACLFLASPAAAYLTGSALLVHGGGERPAFQVVASPPV